MKTPLQRRLDSELASIVPAIAYELRTLSHKIERALTNLNSGQRIDAHLIANSAMLTEQIARWNLIHDLTPLAADDPKKEP